MTGPHLLPMWRPVQVGRNKEQIIPLLPMGPFREYANVILMTVFGFLFLALGLLLLRQASFPGGLLFCGCGLFLFWVGWYDLKRKGTDAYGKTITFQWEDLPAWKKLVIVLAVVLFLLLVLWVVLTVPSTGPDWSGLCIGDCEGLGGISL